MKLKERLVVAAIAAHARTYAERDDDNKRREWHRLGEGARAKVVLPGAE